MSEAEFSRDVAREHVEAALADPALASLRLGGAPVVVIAGAPGRVVYASGAAQSLFAGDLAALGRRLLLGAEPGARRVVALSRSLLPGAAPRLERLRFFFGPLADTVTVLCRRVSVAPGETLFALAVLGMRAPQATARRASDASAPQLKIASEADAPTSAADADEQRAEERALAARSHAPLLDEAAAPEQQRGETAYAQDLAAHADETPARGSATPSARGVRFAWRTDGDHIVRSVAPPLAAQIGVANADIVGRSLVDVARDAGLDPDGRLVAALAARDTFSGVETLWPAGEGLRARVTLGAAPAFGEEDRFDGFRGYGVVRPERVAAPQSPPDDETSTPESPAPNAPSDAIPQAEERLQAASRSMIQSVEPQPFLETRLARAPQGEGSNVWSEVEDEAAAAREIDAIAQVSDEPTPPLAVERETASLAAVETQADDAEREAAFFAPYAAEAAAQPTGLQAEEAPVRADAATIADETAKDEPEAELPGAIDAAAAPVETTEVEPATDDGDRSREDVEIVAVSDAGEAIHRGDVGAEPVAEAPEAREPLFDDELDEEEAPAEQEPASSAANIVPLRPQLPARLADTPSRSPAPELSPGEKSAFEEIGRALGAEPAAEEPEPKLSPAASQRARDLIDLVARFGRSDRPVEEPKAVAPALAAVSGETSAKIAADLPERNAAGVLERLPVGIVVSRFNVPIYANRTLLDLLDYADIDAFHAAGGLDRLFRGREPDSGAAQIETRDGETLPVDARVQAVDWDGQPATLVTLRRAQDSRPQENRPQENRAPDAGEAARAKALELDLRQRDAEARELHAILDTATDGVAVLDAEGRILSLNRSGEALFGFDQNEVAGEPFSTLVAKESQEATAAYFEGVKSGGVQSVLNDGREILARARQGGAIPVFVTLGRLGSGATPKFCAVLRDLTAWKKVERELGDARREAERASALKSDFLAKVSHEIRTPLNAILGFAEVIMDERFGPVGNARYRDYMRDIHKSGEHVLSLVNDLLDLSKIEAGKVDLTFASVDINAVVAECVSIMQPQANRDRVVMRLSLAPNLPNIVADERSMRQIVLNLLSNAVKFNEPGGQAIVSTALTDAGHAVVRIKDTGVGMSDDELEMALEPFRQVSTARKSEGTGLGLPLTKALVEANRASFTIRSRKGEGTMVEVIFPPTRVLAE